MFLQGIQVNLIISMHMHVQALCWVAAGVTSSKPQSSTIDTAVVMDAFPEDPGFHGTFHCLSPLPSAESILEVLHVFMILPMLLLQQSHSYMLHKHSMSPNR